MKVETRNVPNSDGEYASVHKTRGHSNKHARSRFDGETILQTILHSDMKVKQ